MRGCLIKLRESVTDCGELEVELFQSLLLFVNFRLQASVSSRGSFKFVVEFAIFSSQEISFGSISCQIGLKLGKLELVRLDVWLGET